MRRNDMIKHIVRPFAAATLTALLLVPLAPAALAHEGRRQGDLEMLVGFGTEPAYVGQPNSVMLILVHDGKPVVDLGDTLDVEVTFGDAEPLRLVLEPFFEVGEFGTPGDYRAWFIPTRAGQYSFHFTGTIDRERVNQTFTSGPKTFSDVVSTADIQYPVQDPTTGDLAERIDREVPRLASSIEDVKASIDRSLGSTADDVSNAKTIALVGVALGASGLIAGIAGIAFSRRDRA
jgi:hypothetical protein